MRPSLSGSTLSWGAVGSTREIGAFAVFVFAGVALTFGVPLFLATALILLALVAGLAAPFAALASIPTALPWIAMPVAVGSADFTLLELAIGISAVTVGVHLAAEVVRARSAASVVALLRPWPLSLMAAALLIVGAISLGTVVDDRYLPESLRAFRWTIVEPIVVFILCRWGFRKRNPWFMVIPFVAVSAVIAASAVIQILVGRGVVIADGFPRATGPYTHPNNLAFLLERASMFALAVFVLYPGLRRWMGIVTALLVGGLLATLSRGAVAAALAGSTWILWHSPWRRYWKHAIALSGVLLVVAFAIAGDRLGDTGSTGSASTRELVWRSSVRMIRDHPIAGVGLDQFLHQYNSRYVEPAGWPERYTSHPHNLLLDAWLSLGIAGLVILAVGAVLTAQLAWRGRERNRRDPVLLGATAALLVGVVHGLVDNGYFLPDLAVMTWMFLAMLESRSGIADG